jgi:tetratricopeptide (TPR) repeat protein
MPPDYCFPFRLETIDVLRGAQQRNPKNSRAHYYLGNLLFDFQPEEAIKEWEKAVSKDENLPVLHRNLGLGYARIKNDIPRAVKSMERALVLARTEPRIFYELDLLYEAAGVPPQKRLALLEANHKTVRERDDALSREIILLVQLGKYGKALDILENHHFFVWEGGGRIHNVYMDAHLLKGWQHFISKQYRDALEEYHKANEYPENLEVGKPVRGGREAKALYFMGTAYEALGELKQAEACFEKAVARKSGWSELSFYQGLSYMELGEKEKAKQMFDGLKRFAQDRLAETAGMDFFVKFGERQTAANRRAQAHYFLGLSFLGKGDAEKARVQFEKSLELNINHLWAKHYLIR